MRPGVAADPTMRNLALNSFRQREQNMKGRQSKMLQALRSSELPFYLHRLPFKSNVVDSGKLLVPGKDRDLDEMDGCADCLTIDLNLFLLTRAFFEMWLCIDHRRKFCRNRFRAFFDFQFRDSMTREDDTRNVHAFCVLGEVQ